MAYAKPWQSYENQLRLLESRGLQVTNRSKALEYLKRIGYYRLSGYWYSFRERSGLVVLVDKFGFKPPKAKNKAQTITLDTFKPGATFENAVNLYVFDKRLRLLTLDALERIEIALRVDVSHSLGKLDQFAYLRSDLFHPTFSVEIDKDSGVTKHYDWLGRHAKLINQSKEEFVRHNKAKYGLPLAIWVACEVWDFGTMSRLFNGMREQDQDSVSNFYGVRNGRTFATWLRSLNYLRNVCAHHSRLWNRNIIDQPKFPPVSEMPWVAPFEHDAQARARCYHLIRMVCHLLRAINPNSSWPDRMKAHLLGFPDLKHLGLDLAGMGAPPNWAAQW